MSQTYALPEGSWLFRQFDTADDETAYRFRFLHWITCGDRDDFAVIEIIDIWPSRAPNPITIAVVAARHAGVDLRALEDADLPAHVHLLTTADDPTSRKEVGSAEFTRNAWLTVEPAEWRSTQATHPNDKRRDGPIIFQRLPSPGH